MARPLSLREMRMAGFKANCPSCDHGVPVQDVKLVGTKIECPKCKYRFKVEAPKDMPAADVKDKAKPKDKEKSKKGTAEPAKSKKAKGEPKKLDRKMMIGIGLGVLAVVLLIGGGFMMFGSSDGNANKNSLPTPRPRVAPAVVQKGEEDDPTKKIDETPKTPPKPPEVKLARSTANPTNLLPGNTQALVRADLEKLRRTPLYHIIATEAITDVFRSALGLDPRDVETYYQAYVDTARHPFGIVRLKEPTADKPILAALASGKGPKSPLQNRDYFTLKPNPAQDALGKLLSLEAILGTRPAITAPNATPRPLAICFYDTQTILISDQAVLEGFLAGLRPDGYPVAKTEFVKPEVPSNDAPAPAPNTTPMPKVGKTPSPATPAKPTPAKVKNDGTPGHDVSMNPDFCSIDPDLKVLLNSLEMEGTPMLLMAARLEPRNRDLDALKFSLDARPWAAVAASALTNASLAGVAVRSFLEKEIAFQLDVELPNDGETRTVKDRIQPMIIAAASLAAPILGQRIVLEGFGEMAPGATPAGGTAPEVVPPAATPPASVPMSADMSLPLGPSKLSMNIVDRTVSVTASLEIGTLTYSNYVQPRMQSFAAQFQGQMLVLSGNAGRRTLAPAVFQIAGTGQFPRGTVERQGRVDRFGLAYPPATRISFLYDLLPYLGKGDVHGSVDTKQAWYGSQNLSAAESWVPEFLVPEFPASAWRASSPYAEGRSLGATNVVGIAGKGRDAARYNPTDPAHAKDLGVVGYDWGAKVTEITDGTSNTIYMMQVPPTYSRPWMAGGGATVMGVDDTAANPAAEFAAPRGGRPGTYALMADGSVRWIPENIDKTVFLGLVTRAGGETLGDLDIIAPKDGAKTSELKTTDRRK